MKLTFKNNTPAFQNFLTRLKEILLSENNYGLFRKQLKALYYSVPEKEADMLRLIYASENASELKEIISSPGFNPESFEVSIPVDFLYRLPSGAVVTIDSRSCETGGLGKYVCDHTACIINSFKINKLVNNLTITGFIHIPEFPDYDQLAEVLGTGIKGISTEKNKKTVRIMLTGFTQFGTVKDNATGRFLFGDGKTTDFSSFGFFRPSEQAAGSLDTMIKNYTGQYSGVSELIVNGVPVGREYHYHDNKKTELILVRLPVAADLKETRVRPDCSAVSSEGYKSFMKKAEKNEFGDRVQDILEYTVSFTNPDAIISLGVNSFLPSDFYEIETEIFGLDAIHSGGIQPVYLNNRGRGKNNELADAFKIVGGSLSSYPTSSS